MNERWSRFVDLAMTIFFRGHGSGAKDHVIHISTPTETIHYERHPIEYGKIYFSQLGDPEEWKP